MSSQVKVMSFKKMLRDTDHDVITIQALKEGGFKMECTNSEDGTNWSGDYYALVGYASLQNLEGKLLTIMDASFSDKDQRKAVKDIIRRTFWFDWVEHHLYRGKEANPVGMPLSLQEL